MHWSKDQKVRNPIYRLVSEYLNEQLPFNFLEQRKIKISKDVFDGQVSEVTNAIVDLLPKLVEIANKHGITREDIE